jgi:predicted restriction endonuclease
MSRQQFIAFHNEVFNLPRDSFSNFDILKVKSLAEYLYSIRFRFPDNGLKLSEIYLHLHFFLRNNDIPNPNKDFEELFSLELEEVDDVKHHYTNDTGRKFRHWMELASLLDLLANYEHGVKSSRRVLTPFTEEIFLIPSALITPLVRDKVLSINTNSNPGLGNLDSYANYQNHDYRPAYAILNYMNRMQRHCTRFELAIFFGRPDYSLATEIEIIDEAVELGETFPLTQNEQIEFYFRYKNWVDANGNIYSYATSQEPYFKFNAFFILMDSVGLVNYDVTNSSLSLTAFSNSLFSADISPEAVELENLISEIENISDDNLLTEKVAKNRAALISNLISNDNSFVDNINQKAAAKSGNATTTTQTTKWKRDELIREVSKQQANYDCQGCNNPTFIDRHENNFVESHHILEYNTREKGPDVLQNLLVLCPNCHSKIHFARIDIVEDFYRDMRIRNIITINQFMEIHTSLNLLKQNHIDILLKKCIIDETEAAELNELLSRT